MVTLLKWHSRSWADEHRAQGSRPSHALERRPLMGGGAHCRRRLRFDPLAAELTCRAGVRIHVPLTRTTERKLHLWLDAGPRSRAVNSSKVAEPGGIQDRLDVGLL